MERIAIARALLQLGKNTFITHTLVTNAKRIGHLNPS
jgi:hypothetical protein